MAKKKKPQAGHPWAAWLVLSVIVVGAFLLRVVGQLPHIFVGGNVWFRGIDAWYHMRLADAVNFPQWFKWDMFAQYPNGAAVGYMPLNAWLSVNDTVAAFVPPVAGALTLIFVYLIGRELFSSKVGLLAALLVAVTPGEFLHRTLLGFTDHHALEALFMAASVWLLLKALHTPRWFWVVLLGLAMGLYTISWTGTAMFFLIIGIWVWWEFLTRLRANADFTPIMKTVSPAAYIASLLAVQYVSTTTLAALSVLVVGPAILWLLTRTFKDKEKILFALTLLVPVGIVLLSAVVDLRKVIVPIFWGGNTYIQEAAPLTFAVAFATYGIAAFLALAGLWFCRRSNTLFIVWSVVLIVATIGQRRWGYYTVIPISLAAAYCVFYVPKWFAPAVRAAIVGVMIMFLLVTNIQGTARLATLPNNIDADWYVTLTWVRDNTPEPFPNDAYSSPDPAVKPSYGILTWWDYGHWLIRIAHRVPTESPTQLDYHTSEFFTARSETEANAWIQEELSIPYVIVDRTLLEGKWAAILQRAEERTFVPVEETFLYTLWSEQAQTWMKIYERGDIKVFERHA